MIEYLLVLARKQITCPLPGCPSLFVSKLKSPLIIRSYAVVVCIACEDNLQIRAVESGRRRGKWTGERWSMEEKGYDCPLKLFFSICSFDIKLVSRCQCLDAPQPKQQVASGEGGKEAGQRKSDQKLENWWPGAGSGHQTVAEGPLTNKGENRPTLCDFVHQKRAWSSDRSVTCHLVWLADHNALGFACYECCICISLSFWFWELFFFLLLIFLRCWALPHCLLKQTALKRHLCKYRTGMEFSILLQSVYLSKPANFSGSTHASFLRKNFTAPTWNFQWKQPAQSPRQPVCQGTYLGCERSRVKFLASRKIPMVI